MVLVALVLVQGGLSLAFPTGGEVAYRETWKVTETGGPETISGDAERTARFRVKETSRGRTRLQVTFDNLAIRGSNTGMNEDIRSWLDVPNRDQWVTERGIVQRRDEAKGDRPFFGLVLPSSDRSLPDKWTAKVLPPIGSDRTIDFTYRVYGGQSTSNSLDIDVTAKDKVGDVTLTYAGRVSVTAAGEIAFGEMTTTMADASEKTTTVIEYRFRKL